MFSFAAADGGRTAPLSHPLSAGCCAGEDFGCYLNGTALSNGQGWHAYCRPTNETWGEDEAAGGADFTDSEARCEEMALRGWLCPQSWHRHVHEAVALAKWYVDEKPAAVASVALVCSLLAIAACACCLLHRRRMQAQLKRLNAELAAVSRTEPHSTPTPFTPPIQPPISPPFCPIP